MRDSSVSNALRGAVLVISALLANQAFADVIDGEEFRDPTQPVVALGPVVSAGPSGVFGSFSTANLKLSFVRDSSTSPMAVINDKRVTIGDEINGALVVAIDRNGVTLRINDEESRINLYSTNIKSPVADR